MKEKRFTIVNLLLEIQRMMPNWAQPKRQKLGFVVQAVQCMMGNEVIGTDAIEVERGSGVIVDYQSQIRFMR